MKIAIVAENATPTAGGEASLAYYYFKLLGERGHDVRLLIHERTSEDVRDRLPALADRVHTVPDTRFQRLMFRLGNRLPSRLVEILIDAPIYLSTQRRQRELLRELVRSGACDVVLHPAPIAPRAPSFIHDVGVPVVAGPLCGGMDLPKGFRDREGRAARLLLPLSRGVALLLCAIAPGRRKADVLIVAHDETRAALPRRRRGRVEEVPESGVDLEIWKPVERDVEPRPDEIDFLFLGQVRAWKGPDLLVEAFARAAEAGAAGAHLHVVGDGDLRSTLERDVRQRGLSGSVTFHGWLDRPSAAAVLAGSDVMVLPSLRECGGTAVLEAMAVGLPVIATRRGGPARAVEHGVTGLLVDPIDEEQFIDGLADAIMRLSADPDLRARMGAAGRERILSHDYVWDRKVDRVVEILSEVV